MRPDNNTISLEFSSPQAAEKFIHAVNEDSNFRSKVNFLFSVSQRLELKRLRHAAKRPNETPLNFLAFLYVFIAGGLAWFLVSMSANWFLPSYNTTTLALGILVATLSGAIAALGLPSRPASTSNTLMSIRINCDPTITAPLKGIAEKYWH